MIAAWGQFNKIIELLSRHFFLLQQPQNTLVRIHLNLFVQPILPIKLDHNENFFGPVCGWTLDQHFFQIFRL